jgi:hypothetical protein
MSTWRTEVQIKQGMGWSLTPDDSHPFGFSARGGKFPQVLNPMRRDLLVGGSISCRMASKRDLMHPSRLTTFRSSSLSLAANSFCVMIVCLTRTKARITKTLMLIAWELFNTFAAMMAPYSVKT